MPRLRKEFPKRPIGFGGSDRGNGLGWVSYSKMFSINSAGPESFDGERFFDPTYNLAKSYEEDLRVEGLKGRMVTHEHKDCCWFKDGRGETIRNYCGPKIPEPKS